MTKLNESEFAVAFGLGFIDSAGEINEKQVFDVGWDDGRRFWEHLVEAIDDAEELLEAFDLVETAYEARNAKGFVLAIVTLQKMYDIPLPVGVSAMGAFYSIEFVKRYCPAFFYSMGSGLMSTFYEISMCDRLREYLGVKMDGK